MYRQDTGGCGCGGGAASRTGVSRGQRFGRIDHNGQCVCDECEPCGVLECQCRPRFFDGQLITAADFRRLDHYIVAKNRLHNRYLHGVGVVCGLEAVVNAVEQTVTVRTGYALGPCGEDIVVCHDARVDVAALIKERRGALTRSDCAPYSEPARDAEAANQQWILGICYDEHVAKPVASLKSAGSGCGCGGSCGGACGGSGSTSCGCGGNGLSSTRTPPSCEPTQICEGYRFTLTKLPKAVPQRRPVAGRAAITPTAEHGDLPRRIAECVQRIHTELTKLPNLQGANAAKITTAVIGFAQTFKAELGELAGSANASLAERLFGVPIPKAGDKDAVNQARAAIGTMAQIAVDIYRDCVCSALLPPCGEGCADDCVPLAVVTVRSSDLRIVGICNWSARKFAITMPALQYWLGWLPLFQTLRDNIIRLCCQPIRQPRFEIMRNLRIKPAEVRIAAGAAKAAAGAAAAPAGAWTERAEPGLFDALVTQFDQAEHPLAGLEATVLGVMGGQTTAGKPIASELELANPLAAFVLGQLAPTAAGLLSPGAHEDRIVKLEGVVKSLQAKVNQQNRTITALKKKGPKP